MSSSLGPRDVVERDPGAASPQDFEDLGDTEASDPSQQRWQRLLPRLVLGAGIALSIIAIVVGLLVFGILPFGAGAPPNPTTTPVSPSTSLPPSPTTPSNTPIPTMISRQVEVSGPQTYTDPARPYKARYVITLKRGEGTSVAIRCPTCLLREEGGGGATLGEGGDATLEVVIPPGVGEVSLSLHVQGQPCAEWDLAPSDEEHTFTTVCSP
jgi:hypothetical protein